MGKGIVMRPRKTGTKSLDMYEQAFESVKVRESPASELVDVALNFRQMDGLAAYAILWRQDSFGAGVGP